MMTSSIQIAISQLELYFQAKHSHFSKVNSAPDHAWNSEVRPKSSLKRNKIIQVPPS